jgi:hypothetical protein
MRIGVISEGLDSAAHLALNFDAYRNGSIYYSGHSGGGDSGFFCYFSNVHVWLGPANLFRTRLMANAIFESNQRVIAISIQACTQSQSL